MTTPYPGGGTPPDLTTTTTTIIKQHLATTGSDLTTQIVWLALFMVLLGAYVYYVTRPHHD